MSHIRVALGECGKHVVPASERSADGEGRGSPGLMLCGCCRSHIQLSPPNVNDGDGFSSLPHLPSGLISDRITIRAKRGIHLIEMLHLGYVSTKSAVEVTV